MHTIKIAVYVPLTAALAAGRAAYGDTSVTLTDADVASLSPEARDILKPLVSDPTLLGVLDIPTENDRDPKRVQRIEVGTADAVHVLPAIEQRARARAVAYDFYLKVAAEKREAEILDVLAKPLDEWCTSDGRGYCVNDEGQISLDGGRVVRRKALGTYWPRQWAALEDPRIARRRDEALAYIASYNAAWEVQHAAYQALVAERDAARAAEKAADEAKAEACRMALRELASREDDLSRAAAEGYAVEQKMLDRLADRIGEKGVYTGVYETTDDFRWSSPAERSAPSAAAFRMLDAVKASTARENETLPKAIGQWEVSRIVRVDTCKSSKHRNYVTCVLATLETPLGIREVTISIEPQECEHDVEYT